MTRTASLFVVSSVSLALAGAAAAGELFLLGNVPFSYAYNASADGSIVAGSDPIGCWYWTRETWVVRIDGSLAFGNGVGGYAAVTADGSQIMCPTLVPNQDGLEKAEVVTWDRALNSFDTSVGSLGYHCDISRSSGWAMSPDASYVCGLVWDVGCAGKGFVYERATDSFNLLPTLDALGNVILPGVLDGRPRADLEARGLALLEELGLGARADHRPEAMSGGEQQRVAIARALLFEPGVLLADEPTGNLDSASADRLWTILREVASRRQMTVVVVTHEPVAASNCVETFVLRDGAVAGRFESYGLTPSELVLRAASAGR